MSTHKRGLGMGLAALLGEAAGPLEESEQGARKVPLECLTPSPLQPRRRFPEKELELLAASLREHGVLQPLVVRPTAGAGSEFEIVAGERRWRAAQRAGIHELPVVVRRLSDRQVLELALVENLQREDLGPLEEADAYRRLIEDFGHTQEEVAAAVGKSRSHVANMLRLLQLPARVRQWLEEGRLSAGHARALLSAEDPEGLARQVMAEGWSVRQTEEKVRAAASARPRRRRTLLPDPDIEATARCFSDMLGLEVSIRPRGNGGTLTIRYSDLRQLEELRARLESTKTWG